MAHVELTAAAPAAPASNGQDLSKIPARDVFHQAATLVDKYEHDKAVWTRLASDAAAKIKDLTRENELLRLELTEAKNNLQTVQATVEDLRQENSDLRALQTEQHALARHLVSRYENFHIPLPVRKRPKNGKPQKAEPQKLDEHLAGVSGTSNPVPM